MAFRAQTAIRGIVSVATINLAARAVAYGKHILITAYFGLSAPLDAFYVAATVLSMAVFVFGDIFDSLGIPRLVKVLQEEGETSFRELAGSIFSLSLALSGTVCLLLLLIGPWTPWIAPGLSPEKKGMVLRNLLLLAPMALLYLPYHAVGSFLRARRRFQAFYLGELIIASVTFLILLLRHDIPDILPLSFSLAYIAVFLYIVAAGLRGIRPRGIRTHPMMARMVRMVFLLLPLYLTNYLFALVDRAFASFLPTGGISALFYGAMIAMIPYSILMPESIVITPLSETADREPMLREIVSAILMISVPLALFTALHAPPLVKAAFERGVFTPASTRATGDALAFLSLAIPAYFLWPLFYRVFQILENLGAIGWISLSAVLLNAALNFLFLSLDLGIRGIALATSISWYALVAGAALLFFRSGLRFLDRSVLEVGLFSVGAALVSLLLSAAVSPPATTTPGLLLRGAIFLLADAGLYWIIPHGAIRHVRDTIHREFLRPAGGAPDP
ncbi:MAG: murein biosynthesis integral membrane protein MurJ [Deltaproteobacteria bacterium]